MAAVAQTRFAHKLFEPAPWTISEAKTHCVMIFDKLRLQREQGRFCDVILKVNGREFPAHRCVLASCSQWFDTKFKVHKTLKEVVEVENCKNYEVFHLVLTYMYSGQVVIDKDNVADILEISSKYSINKLKTYCSEFLEKNLKSSNCLNVIELAEKCHLVDLSKQTLAYIDKHFDRIIQYHEIDRKSQIDLQQYINNAWYFPSELVLRIVARWVNQHSSREDHFVSLLHNVNWSTLDPGFISRHLDNDVLYSSSQEALLTILHLLDKNNIKLNARHAEMYRELQKRLLPNNELEQELEDSNSFLSFALNSAVMKDLEHSEVDETFSSFILQTDAIGDSSQYGPFRHPSGNDMEAYKTEAEEVPTSHDMIQFNETKTSIGDGDARSASLKESSSSPGTDQKQLLQDVPSSVPGRPPASDSLYCIAADRSCREARPSYPTQSCAQTPHSQYQLQSPGAEAASNLGFRAQALGGCDDVYKQYNPPPTSEVVDPYYNKQHAYITKHTQSYQAVAATEMRCMQFSNVPNVTDASFNQDLNDMYREDQRHTNYMCPIFRENQIYPSETDHYRGMCSAQPHPYDSFKLEAVMERQSYTSYKENEMRTPPPPANSELRPEKVERMNSSRSDFDLTEYQILEQVINEQRLSEKSATKRYDPKFRALAEASKQTDPDMNSQLGSPQELFDYKAAETGPATTEDKSLRADFETCRISEKAREKEMLACEYEAQMKAPSYQEQAILTQSAPCAMPASFSRTDELLEECRQQEETPTTSVNQSEALLHFQDTNNSINEFEESKESSHDSVLETPPKKAIETSSPTRAKTPARLTNPQVILTPKEKYAKEINAERKLESVQKNVFEDYKSEETQKISSVAGSAAPRSPQLDQPLPVAPDAQHPPVIEGEVASKPKEVKVLSKVPLAFKILRAKKKMATKKKLILEHGEVRLTHKQKIKLKPLRKRLAKKPGLDRDSASNKSGSKALEVKKIVNRKDKLLAEHRSKQTPEGQANPDPVSPPSEKQQTINLDDLVIQLEYSCPFCDFVSLLKKDYFKHIKTTHLTQQPYQCPKCEHKHPKLSSLLAHYNTHKARFSCSTCQQQFLTNQDMKRHQKVHRPSPTFPCAICGKVFNLKCTLEQHQAVHTDEKKFKCKQCTFSTKYSSHLSAHRRIHEGNVHKCTLEGCQYWTPKKTLLNAHIRAHNGEKTFICGTCNKGFVEAGQLKRHERIHNDAKPFKCDVGDCAYSCKRKDKLKEHKARLHKPAPKQEPEITRPSKLTFINKYYWENTADQTYSHAENRCYSVEGGEEFPDSQIPYCKEEILGV